MTLKNAERALLHRTLLSLGHESNTAGHHFVALACFEAAYQIKDDMAALLSAVNMRLKLGQIDVVIAVYSRLLAGSEDGTDSLALRPCQQLTAPQQDHIRRKYSEACEARQVHLQAPHRFKPFEDEIAQLLHHRRSRVLEHTRLDNLR